ncbi:MAG: hypothetical protein WCP01_10710 [Methylococcaceae bacterium]
MLKIQNRSQLHHIIDPDIHKLITLRLSQLDSSFPTPMIIMVPGDTLSSIEKEIGFPILTNLFDDISYPDPDFMPSCEALEDHGGCYEMLFILGDGDNTVEIFIPKTGVDPLLLSMCSRFAIMATQPKAYFKEIPMNTTKNTGIHPIDPLVSEVYETLTDNMKEEFHERAAIIEFESNTTREHAERMAMNTVLTKMNAEK